MVLRLVVSYHLHGARPYASNVGWFCSRRAWFTKILQETTFRWLAMYFDHGGHAKFRPLPTFTCLARGGAMLTFSLLR